MYKNFYIERITKDNKNDVIIDSIVKLEQTVLAEMKSQGREEQFLDISKEKILEYIDSSHNQVVVALKSNKAIFKRNNVIATTYITGNQIPFTYNDITKYFKYGDAYKEYVKSKYTTEEYSRLIKKIYIEKILAFRYARDIILKGNLSQEEYANIKKSADFELVQNNKLIELIDKEYDGETNKFNEKSKIIDEVNQMMSLYMKYVKGNLQKYEEFYWITFKDLEEEFSKTNINEIHQFDGILSSIEVYDKILEYQKYKISEKSINSEAQKYYDVNTKNTLQIDTYITSPEEREKGLAKIIAFEGIKKSLEEQYKDKNSDNVYIVSKLHKDNLSSKYVLEFFGLKDYLFVNTRANGDEEVHILGMKKQQIPEYLLNVEKKIAVLYGYNPNNINISFKERNKILNEQLNYETAELQRLENMESSKDYYGKYIAKKVSKIGNLQKMIEQNTVSKEKIK